ncbi:aconitase [Halanaerobium saccharolyticum]|uniref:Aconitase n=1 Tax=Halanaerobium saccharolyticum TaxID=43595 RepID=A0A4R7ZAM6_9FIRM|nr:aconitase family protein [Halanaerobium saccharolyticum]RAK08636.1 aconitase [Halanaerobium saccharolyticum]TDW07221.1 aconitase [Halanaerobium saccharolyticum]TDX60188.1 aconitase [Halanaerobium saccharolyticum]
MEAKLKTLLDYLKEYKKKAVERKNAYGLDPRPLEAEEVEALFAGLKVEGLENKTFAIFEEERLDQLVLRLIAEEVKRGTFPASHAKAEGLVEIIKEAKIREEENPYLRSGDALELLADMKGGAATSRLIDLFAKEIYRDQITEILKETVLVTKADFEKLKELAAENSYFKKKIDELMLSWAYRDFAENWKLEDQYQGLSLRVGDNITTGHLSPSKNANSRTDQPRHAQFVMDGRDDEEDLWGRLEQLKDQKAEAETIFFTAGKALGEGSSRKSATYTMQQLLGQPVAGEPEKKKGGVVVAKSFAPIFKESLVASGILPLEADTTEIEEGDSLKVDLKSKKLLVNDQLELKIELPIDYKLKKIAAGGMTYFDAGNQLQAMALDYCQENGIETGEVKTPAEQNVIKEDSRPPQTLAQKIVAHNRLDGKDTILPGETAQVKMRGAFSQDTTGPMTMDEYQSMAGEDFGAEFVVQSLCHTGECPSSAERDTHKFLHDFVTERGGVCLQTGEGIIHTIGNRFVLPTDVIVGGDSHTRTPRGISFPAASDIVAGVMKYGKQDLTMDESVKVKFTGQPPEGITARDLVSALVVYADKTVGKDIYNGRIIEMEGVDFLTSDERYILTNAVAERSASAGVVPSDETTVETIKENLEYLKSRPDADSSPSVKNTIQAVEEYLEDPVLFTADEDAEYAAEIIIPLEELSEPLVAKPHHPDNVAPLSEVEGEQIDEVYIGSCVGGDLKSIQEAAAVISGHQIPQDLNVVVGPASRDIYEELIVDGTMERLTRAGATVIMPGCGLCMGNKRRIGSGATAFTTTTRNYQSRIGPSDSRTYLGSAQVAGCVAVLGHIPSPEEYFKLYK